MISSSTSESVALSIDRLVKHYGDTTAVAGLSLSLGGEELLALVGPSGCGKSTVMRAIAGLVAVDEGVIRLGDQIVDDGSAWLPPERRSVGLVFQEPSLFPHLSVRKNVGFGIRDLSKNERMDRIREMLELVNLAAFSNRFPHELSGGERQRVALARALAPRPSLMLFDEPFASLDHNLRVRLRRDLVAALRATRTPSVFVTHYQEEALTIGDRIAIMRAGKIVQVADPATIFHAPNDDFITSFMGVASFLPVHRLANGYTTELGPVELQGRSASDVRVAVRPDDVEFVSKPSGRAEIVSVEYYGSEWLVTVRLSDGGEVLASTSHLNTPTVGERGQVRLVGAHRQMVVARSEASSD